MGDRLGAARGTVDMKIWHLGACSSPLVVNGVNMLVYSLVEEQLKAGHEVCLLLENAPDDAGITFARRTGATILVVHGSLCHSWTLVFGQLKRLPPDIVHMHSAFIPRQAFLGLLLRRAKIPYVVTPHGGYSPCVLSRDRLKKTAYSLLIEKARCRRAAGISAVTSGEERDIRSFVPGFKGVFSCIPNSIELKVFKDKAWSPKPGRPELTFLGRFDVTQKGLDILVDIARLSPEVDIHLFGTEDSRSQRQLATLRSNLPPNVFFHRPIFGDEKAEILASSTFYIHASRWEAFGISIAEAMYVGLPCVIASTNHIASLIEQNDLGLVFHPDPHLASASIRQALRDNELMARWSARSKEFARKHFVPAVVAQNFEEFYQQSIAGWRRSTDGEGPALSPSPG
jgi:glycosyltransferase involved in cell wall biosynthesis